MTKVTKIVLTQTMLVTDAAALNKLCDSIKRRGKALQNDMHKAACSVLQHVGKHGDIRPVNRLVEALPNVARKNALMTWFESFGQITFENGKAKFDKDGKTRLGTALEKPFWRFQVSEGGEYQPLNTQARVAALVAALRADADKARRAGVDVPDHGHLLAALVPFCPEQVAQ